MVETGNLVDCIVNLPSKLFLNTQIPAALWFLSRDRKNGKFRNRSGEILFIDARNMGELINRRTRVMSRKDIEKISGVYHNWRNPTGQYEDEKVFCCSVPLVKVKELDYVLTPARYVGLPDEEDVFDFNERFTALKAEFKRQLEEEKNLNDAIIDNLSRINLQ
jgi:type I restriction enzyme M protein